jgi:hypothetical protein
VIFEFPNLSTSRATLTVVKKLSQVQEILMPVLEEGGPDDMQFQHNEAPPLFHKEVADFLNRSFLKKWIGRG